MLAERRQRVNYVLNPRNNSWAADESNLGKKLMEKMGWSKGKGLGKDEQGDTDHIRVNYKNDAKGMGFAGPVDDPVLHQNDFADLLAKLNEAQEPAPVVKEVVSLEKRSESSKSRVHYKKFTRGKDLSRYSSKDLECIIGSGKKKAAQEEPQEVEIIASEVGAKDHSHGIETVTGGLMADYFKKKMMAKGLWKGPMKQEPVHDVEQEPAEDDDAASKSSEEEFSRVGFKMSYDDEDVKPLEEKTEEKKKKKKSKDVTEVKGEKEVDILKKKYAMMFCKAAEEPVTKMVYLNQGAVNNDNGSKSSKDESARVSFKMNNGDVVEEVDQTVQKKKKKKGKDVTEEIKVEVKKAPKRYFGIAFCKATEEPTPEITLLSEERKKKKPKKKKKPSNSEVEIVAVKPKEKIAKKEGKKKKMKRKFTEEIRLDDEVDEVEIVDEQPSKKKMKKNKAKKEEVVVHLEENSCDSLKKKIKKKKNKVGV